MLNMYGFPHKEILKYFRLLSQTIHNYLFEKFFSFILVTIVTVMTINITVKVSNFLWKFMTSHVYYEAKQQIKYTKFCLCISSALTVVYFLTYDMYRGIIVFVKSSMYCKLMSEIAHLKKDFVYIYVVVVFAKSKAIHERGRRPTWRLHAKRAGVCANTILKISEVIVSNENRTLFWVQCWVRTAACTVLSYSVPFNISVVSYRETTSIRTCVSVIVFACNQTLSEVIKW